MRILLINQAYHPDMVATAQHAHDLARFLVAHGHQVQVVASRSVYGQTGATLPKHETVDGVEIHRVGVSLFGKKNILGRLADFALFYLLATWRMLRLPKSEVVICLTTPPLIGLAGWLTTRLRGGCLVSWVMDLYPHVAVAGGLLKKGGLSDRLLGTLNRFTLNRSAKVVVLGRCMQAQVLALGVNEAQVVLIGPWAAEEKVDAAARRVEESTRRAAASTLTVMYAGNLGLAHDISAFKQALLQLKEDARIRFLFSGGGKQRPALEAFAKAQAGANITFLPYLPREALAAQLAEADVHLISQAPAFTGLVVPSKLYGVLAIGRAAAVVADESAEVACVVRESRCGEVFEPSAAGGNALAAWLLMLAENQAQVNALGAAALQAHHQKHQPKLRLAQWLALLETTAGQPNQ